MQIPPDRISQVNFPSQIKQVQAPALSPEVKPVNFNTINTDTRTPTSYQYGMVAQVINSRYLFELSRRKDIKQIIKGRKLKELLSYDYSLEEFESLPNSLRTLVKFDRAITSAEILQFMEALDESHEISFRDYAFDRIKFRALFEALGDLVDIEMQAGPTTYVPLSDDFELKRKIKEIFIELKTQFRDKLRFRESDRESS